MKTELLKEFNDELKEEIKYKTSEIKQLVDELRAICLYAQMKQVDINTLNQLAKQGLELLKTLSR